MLRSVLPVVCLLCFATLVWGAEPVPPFRVGVIGLDTSHSIAFTKILNNPEAKGDLAGFRVTAAYPRGSKDIASSIVNLDKYTAEMKAMDVAIVDSIEKLVEQVDGVLLESNDGRVHLEQVLPVLKSKKPCFIDKPVAGSLTDVVAIYEAAEENHAPIFTSSALRYGTQTQKLRGGSFGEIFGCDAYSPSPLEKTHPDLFWYGIHGVETLFTVMGPGCESVTRATTGHAEVVTGTWKDGRIGTFRGIKQGPTGYGGTAFTTKGIQQVGTFEGYEPLVVEIAKFLRSGKSPVNAAESIEIYAFMEAADQSKRDGGKPVQVAKVLEKAQAEAKRLKRE